MSSDHNNIPQDSQQCFSDIWFPELVEGRSGGLTFQPHVDNHDLNDNESRNFNAQQSMLAPVCPTYTQPGKRCSDVQFGEDDVFTNGQPSFNQASHQPYMTYSTGTMDHRYQQNNRPAQGNMHVQEQNNYDAYLHSSSPDTASISNSPYTPNIRQDFSVSPTGNQPVPNAKANPIPSVSDYAGENTFEIHFANQTESAVKSAQYTYSSMLGKLFVKRNVLCPIQFRCLKQPPLGSYIRALPVYMKPEDVTDVVRRCPNHQIQDSTTDHLAHHLVRAEQPGNNNIQYMTAPDGRESVTINYSLPEVGSEYITVFYSYMCLSSCVGGISRRPIMTIFTLESPEGVVLGRRCIEVRVCCCPGRDRGQEERRKRKPALVPVIMAKKKKPSSLPSTSTAEPEGSEKQEFLLVIKGKEKFEMLKKIKEALDLKELVSKEQKEEHEQREVTAQESAMKRILSNYFKKGDGDDSGPFPT